MPLFHRYPQHPNAHPQRPWWRRDSAGGWRRTDGLLVYTADYGVVMVRNGEHSVLHETPTHAPEPGVYYRPPASEDFLAQAYALDPLPDPPPLCNQVWVWPETKLELTIVSVEPDASGGWIVTYGDSVPHPVGPECNPWPPPPAVLAFGPLSPWAPAVVTP